tara:strand:+ start:565 stop:2364 length:1800 start_codon:yes stop_codon:yes gene_type:complete
MACLSVRFSCPIDTVGSNTAICSWIVTCCDGKEIQIDVPVNTFATYCLDNPSKDTIIPNGTGGEWTTKGLVCDTNCGTADPTPIAGYVYYEYENCNAASQKQIFRAPAGFTAWPNTIAYQSICWSNGISTTSVSYLDIPQPNFNDCATCLAAIAPTPPPPTPPIPPGTTQYCLSFVNSLNVVQYESSFEIILGSSQTITFNRYEINGAEGVYEVNTGVYQITGVTSEWPIAFLNNGIENEISYTGTNLERNAVALDGNTYSFYSGTITLNVNDDFGAISYQTCFPESTNGLYFGGENNLRFSTACNSSNPPTPTPPSPSPTPPSVVPPIPSPVDTEWTVSYSENSKGWPSFYSYIPEYMIGMNNFFYTFNGGNLFQHNTNPLRNNYYGQQFHSQITSVFNQNPLENKIFKTLNLESNDAWQSYLETDIQINGFMQGGWFEKKEGAWFAYLRQRGEVPALKGQYAMRSANGIGQTSSVAITQGTTTLSFSTNPLVSIGNFISVGDYVYHAVPQYTDVVFGGIVTQINIDLQNGINQLIVSTTSADTVVFPLDNPYIMFIKSSEAESHGLLGHYCVFTITNFNTQATELFAVESEVMKSYP